MLSRLSRVSICSRALQRSVGSRVGSRTFACLARSDFGRLSTRRGLPQSRWLATGAAEAGASAAGGETMEFQAETRKLLDIVANALYTEKEVFLRELVSNASDSLEKLRHMSVATGGELPQPELPLEIQISADEKNNTLTIQDFGLGMTKEDMINNLGRIGKSGSQDFRQSLADAAAGDKGAATNIIGQFGVGFYSAFMVSDTVTVYSKSAMDEGTTGHCWTSSGTGTYEIAPVEMKERGTKIVLQLRDNANQYAQRNTLETIVKKYSNFVGFTIRIDSDVVNTVKPLWLSSAKDVSDEENTAFYQFIAHAFDKPHYTLRYQTDSPLNIRSLLYVGEDHMEKFGMGRMEPGVSLFSRKVLIQAKSPALLPDWLRFVRGVVDSEDVPLNIGREHLQDNSLVRRLNNILTKRILRFFADEAKRRPEEYNKFFANFGMFLKEGVCADRQWKDDIAPLLRMESSHTKEGEFTSFEEYIERMKDSQKIIHYLVAPNRELALQSPYYEGYRDKGVEVLFLYSALDDFVVTSLEQYRDTPLSSIESGENVDLDAVDKDSSTDDDETKDDSSGDSKNALAEDDAKALCTWLRDTLPERLSVVRTTKRLSATPAIIVDHDSSFHRMMAAVDPSNAPKSKQPQSLEINPSHNIIKQLAQLRSTNPALATEVAEQLVDNALIAAGLLEDARGSLARINRFVELAMNNNNSEKKDDE